MDSITHFSHEHPLNLLKQIPTSVRKSICFACEEQLLHEETHGDVYGCELCESFFLHKSCAQLPMEIVHKSHEQHSLFLILKPPTLNYINWCKLCDNSVMDQFFCYCYLCNFALDVKCVLRTKERVVSANKDLTFPHPSHKHHPLMVQPRPCSFLCDACGVEGKDLLYKCSPCSYWVHKRCAMLPSTTLSHIHSHPLTLAFGLPSQYYHRFYYYCDSCEVLISPRDPVWLYYCELCRYFVHIRCMEKKKDPIEVDEGLLTDDLPCLPISDTNVELIQPFFLKHNTLANIQPKISIFSHKHPLIYSNDKFIEDDNEDGEEILCDGIEPIFSPPYYHCVECRYFLHLTCAKLPLQFQHPDHPHQLTLTSKTRFDEAFRCDRCRSDSNGFFFYCTTEGCGFHLDLRCAALPNVLKHESHHHPLSQIPALGTGHCSCCSNTIYNDDCVFGCKRCKFYLHIRCVLLPKTTKSRFDTKHPLFLEISTPFLSSKTLGLL